MKAKNLINNAWMLIFSINSAVAFQKKKTEENQEIGTLKKNTMWKVRKFEFLTLSDSEPASRAIPQWNKDIDKNWPDGAETLDGTSKPCVIRGIGWNNVLLASTVRAKVLGSSHEKAFVKKIVVLNREAWVWGKEEFRWKLKTSWLLLQVGKRHGLVFNHIDTLVTTPSRATRAGTHSINRKGGWKGYSHGIYDLVRRKTSTQASAPWLGEQKDRRPSPAGWRVTDRLSQVEEHKIRA